MVGPPEATLAQDAAAPQQPHQAAPAIAAGAVTARAAWPKRAAPTADAPAADCASVAGSDRATVAWDAAADAPQFRLPVDSESKATRLALLSFARPHMRAFHLAWLSFFLSFFSTFAAAAILPAVRDQLDLTQTDIGNAGIASVCGAIGSRVIMGTVADAFGARVSVAALLLLSAPAIFGMALVTNAAGFVALRATIGLNLSMFVVNQYWVSGMFNTRILGCANATAAGWGNLGGGVAILVMPALVEGLSHVVPPGLAWRWAMFVPALLQVACGVVVLAASDDTPTGKLCVASPGPRLPDTSIPCVGPAAAAATCVPGAAPARRRHRWPRVPAAALNYRTYLLAIAYAMSFGVELTVHNVITSYFFDHFGLGFTAAGLVSSIYGLMNAFTRTAGGLASDMAARRAGMRGRLWVLFGAQLLGGAACALLGFVSGSLVASVAAMVVFSLFTQAACGCLFGVAPFVSHRSPGFAMGMIASGGNVGSAVLQAVFFTFFDMPSHKGFVWMGITVLVLTSTLLLLYFPQWGGMVCRPQQGCSEESYYLKEWSQSERAEALHLPALAFAYEAKSERGRREAAGAQPDAQPVDSHAAPKGPAARFFAAAGEVAAAAAKRLLPCGPPGAGRRAGRAGAADAASDPSHSSQVALMGGGGGGSGAPNGRRGATRPGQPRPGSLDSEPSAASAVAGSSGGGGGAATPIAIGLTHAWAGMHSAATSAAGSVGGSGSSRR